MPLYRARFTAADKVYFGKLLTKLMEERGMTGAELARKASLHMPGNKTIGRDSISWYTNGKRAPGPIVVKALARALDVAPEFLLPRAHNQAPGEPAPEPLADPNTFRTSQLPDGRVHIQIDKMVPLDVAWKITELVMKPKP